MQARTPPPQPDVPPLPPEARTPSRGGMVLAALASVALVGAVLMDAAGVLGLMPQRWPPISHALLATGIALALLTVLLRMLRVRRGAPRVARATLLDLIAIGLLLGAWRLRGHPEIPPDPPLVGASVLALALLALAAWWRVRRARHFST